MTSMPWPRYVSLLTVGTILTVCGFFGPEDGGALEGCGLVLIFWTAWKLR